MEIYDDLERKYVEISLKELKQMRFIFNSLNDGWSVKKQGDKYVFKKKHDGNEEIFMEDYIDKFIEKGLL